uniref:Uncharacterized protein n=1 Tax=Knipowitschia caucasica TaxID=637954 RepID=A0AAV2MG27_KNICA
MCNYYSSVEVVVGAQGGQIGQQWVGLYSLRSPLTTLSLKLPTLTPGHCQNLLPAFTTSPTNRQRKQLASNCADRNTGNHQNVQNTGSWDALGTSEARTPNTDISRHPNRHNHNPVAPEGRCWIRPPMRTCHSPTLDLSGPEPHSQSGTGMSSPAAALLHTSP